MARSLRILIVGGGIGGLAAALALERQHAEVIVCEQSPKLSEIGAGIGLAPNAIKALRALGLEGRHQRGGLCVAIRRDSLVERRTANLARLSRRLSREIRRAERHHPSRRSARDFGGRAAIDRDPARAALR